MLRTINYLSDQFYSQLENSVKILLAGLTFSRWKINKNFFKDLVNNSRIRKLSSIVIPQSSNNKLSQLEIIEKFTHRSNQNSRITKLSPIIPRFEQWITFTPNSNSRKKISNLPSPRTGRYSFYKNRRRKYNFSLIKILLTITKLPRPVPLISNYSTNNKLLAHCQF